MRHCRNWLAAGLLLNAGSALAKGGQVMFRPQPLHQLPKLPCHVFPACARPASRSEPQTTWLAHLASLDEAVIKVLLQLRTTVSPQPSLDSSRICLFGVARWSNWGPDNCLTLLSQNRIGNYSTKLIVKMGTRCNRCGVASTPPSLATPISL